MCARLSLYLPTRLSTELKVNLTDSITCPIFKSDIAAMDLFSHDNDEF